MQWLWIFCDELELKKVIIANTKAHNEGCEFISYLIVIWEVTLLEVVEKGN
jgi:hypothetical protein